MNQNSWPSGLAKRRHLSASGIFQVVCFVTMFTKFQFCCSLPYSLCTIYANRNASAIDKKSTSSISDPSFPSMVWYAYPCTCRRRLPLPLVSVSAVVVEHITAQALRSTRLQYMSTTRVRHSPHSSPCIYCFLHTSRSFLQTPGVSSNATDPYAEWTSNSCETRGIDCLRVSSRALLPCRSHKHCLRNPRVISFDLPAITLLTESRKRCYECLRFVSGGSIPSVSSVLDLPRTAKVMPQYPDTHHRTT